MQIIQEITASVSRPENVFTVEQIRDDVVIFSEAFNNAVTTAGMNANLNTFFGATAKVANWYIGLINSTGFVSVAEADTMASHAGWTEFTTYTESTRLSWVATVSTDKTVTGTVIQTFTIGTVSAQSVQGLFVTDTATKGGATGLLWSTGLFSTPQGISTGDTFRITYTLTLGN